MKNLTEAIGVRQLSVHIFPIELANEPGEGSVIVWLSMADKPERGVWVGEAQTIEEAIGEAIGAWDIDHAWDAARVDVRDT